jgi:hypothetical protein
MSDSQGKHQAEMPALAFVFLCSVFKEHCPCTRSTDRRC